MDSTILDAIIPITIIAIWINKVMNPKMNKPDEMKKEAPSPNRLKLFFKKLSAFLRKPDKQEKFVWNELTQLHKVNSWRHGVYETEKYVESTFTLAENKDGFYRYLLLDNELHFDVCVINNFPPEMTTDLFVLASHFNNLLKFGKVVIDIPHRTVTFSYQNEVSFYAVYPKKIEEHLSRHFFITRDVYWAFDKFLQEREEPAIIIGELLNIQKNRGEKSEGN
jgi:hypothetical protein